MTLTGYETELDRLGATYALALNADIHGVKTAIAGASDFSIVGVGFWRLSTNWPHRRACSKPPSTCWA